MRRGFRGKEPLYRSPLPWVERRALRRSWTAFSSPVGRGGSQALDRLGALLVGKLPGRGLPEMTRLEDTDLLDAAAEAPVQGLLIGRDFRHALPPAAVREALAVGVDDQLAGIEVAGDAELVDLGWKSLRSARRLTPRASARQEESHAAPLCERCLERTRVHVRIPCPRCVPPANPLRASVVSSRVNRVRPTTPRGGRGKLARTIK